MVQADRYNRRRSAVIIAAITSTRAHSRLPCKLLVEKASLEGRSAGLKLDSVVDCQTLATVPKDQLVRRLGRFPDEFMSSADHALADALDYAAVTAALEPLLALARDTAAHVLAVHHLGKSDRAGGDGILGSTRRRSRAAPSRCRRMQG